MRGDPGRHDSRAAERLALPLRYDLRAFGLLIADDVRMPAYRDALQRAVTPGSTVVDIGAGTGIFSLLACSFGAAKVYAIEPNPAIQIGMATADANGFADRIEFIRKRSTEVSLPSPADVVVSDLRGVLPYFEHNVPTIADARKRLLKPGGVLIPQRDTLKLALVHSPEQYAELSQPWDSTRFGLDISAALSYRMNVWVKARFQPHDLCSEVAPVTELDYTRVVDPTLRCTVRTRATSRRLVHGFCVWFDTELLPGIGFSNAPGAAPALYGSAFFPWLRPVELLSGCEVTVALSAFLIGDDYVWRWETTIRDVAGAEVSRFNQSTFWAGPLRDDRRRYAADLVLRPTEEVRVDAFIMSCLDGTHSLGDVAELVSQRFPEKFGGAAQALRHVADVASRYS